MIENSTLYDRMLAGMEAFFGRIGRKSPAGRTIHRDGVLAAVCPEMRHRSVFNSVAYRDAGALEAALDDLARAYDEAGVLAWTVWTPETDVAARDALERAGHRLDATPQAMAASIDEVALAGGAVGLDWQRADGLEEMCAILESAFGWEAEATSKVMAGLHEDGQVYVARVDGRPAACVATLDAVGDCAVWNVGTLAEARGRGLASGLMRQALLDARARGCATTSLQATAAGHPVYQRLGYRDLGVIEMWERRGA